MSECPTLPFADPDPPEEWRPVAGYEAYDVSNLGRVQSRCRRKPRILKPTRISASNPHMKVGLYRDGVMKPAQVAHLVVTAFIGQRPEGQVVRHGPGGVTDNRLANLYYGTQSENMRDKERDGTVQRGEKNNLAALTDAIVRECRLRCAAGEWHETLAREFGVTARTMWMAVTGQTWGHVDAPAVATVPRHPATDMSRKLTPKLVREIRARHAAGELMKTLAEEYGTSHATISMAVGRKTWKRVA